LSPGLAATSTDTRSWLSRSDDLWNYQVGLVFKPTPESSLYVSTSSSATPPGSYLAQGSEGNGLTPGRGEANITPDDLKVEKTKSYEVGAKWNLFGDSLALTLAAFQT